MEEERAKYNISIDSYRTNLSVMQNERAEGREKGREEGRAEIRIANALSMLADNMPIELVAKYSGLTIEEVKAL